MNAIFWGLIAAGVLPVGGCETSRKTPTSAEETPLPVEYRTVEFVQKSESDIREHMAQWQREGWSVMSISKPLPRADGTVLRSAELSRREP
jgi:hypothetical protein